ncbi:hypothetical protein CSKR_110611 [Clonorchis sinensis]|uniref:Uncharacterized protein n=1 Tax=Clonorchis sinensis TaxID=79923 RepID=A0A8T1LYX7_CLOSI|nr:hypothetical protein CSKR_110611 [Clonorchis sinensis]
MPKFWKTGRFSQCQHLATSPTGMRTVRVTMDTGQWPMDYQRLDEPYTVWLSNRMLNLGSTICGTASGPDGTLLPCTGLVEEFLLVGPSRFGCILVEKELEESEISFRSCELVERLHVKVQQKVLGVYQVRTSVPISRSAVYGLLKQMNKNRPHCLFNIYPNNR